MSADQWRALPPGLAARAAGLHGDVDFLIEMVSSSDPRARVFAAAQLRDLKDPRAIPALMGCLKSPDATGKISVLKAIREIGDSRPADAVFEVAQSVSEPFSVRGQAAGVLVTFGDRRGVTTLASLFSETAEKHHRQFRKWALPLLVESNGTEALPALRAARSEVGALERRRIDRAIRTLERLKA